VASKRFSELQEEFFATTRRLRLPQGAEEKLALLNELQRIVEESRRALSETKCPTAQALFENYSVAAHEYSDAANKLSNFVGSHDEFEAAERQAQQTSRKCRGARSALARNPARAEAIVAGTPATGRETGMRSFTGGVVNHRGRNAEVIYIRPRS
jgi:hypothetical protein